MTVHHSSGQIGGLARLDIRIFRSDIRHQEIGVTLDNAADDRKGPQDIKDLCQEQCHSRAFPAFRCLKVEEMADRQFFV